MNLNILTYMIYGFITAFIIIKVGWMFYVNGAHYLHEVFENEMDTANTINKLLLVGYYLLNLGYVAVSLSFWPIIDNYLQVIELVAKRTSWIVLSLAFMHYINMLWVRLLKKYLQTT